MTSATTLRAAQDEQIILPEPSLPQANTQGVIDVAALDSGDFVLVRIPNDRRDLWHPTPGDVVWAYLTDAQSGVTVTSEIAVVVDDPLQASWDAKFAPGKIPNGSYQATYQKWNLVWDVVASAPAAVTIEGSSATGYPGPIFPGAAHGVLYYSALANQGGAEIRTNCGIQPDDQVTFYWRGVDRWGRDVPSAAYQTPIPLTPSSTDLHNGYVTDKIPFSKIRPLGNLGSGVGHYEVLRKGMTHTSLNTGVVISWSDISTLQVTSTSGAPVATVQPTDLYPCNIGTVFGEPGLAVTVSVSSGQIVEADPGDPTIYPTRFDENGLASFSVMSNGDRVIVISALAAGSGAMRCTATYFDYQVVNTAGIKQYAYTTSAPSDGVSACTIYFQVMDAFNGPNQTVTVAIIDAASSAQIVGADSNSLHASQIYLNDDGSAYAQIVDAYAETVRVTLSVTGQADVVRLDPLGFISFPSVS
jgi:hypothetical protein